MPANNWRFRAAIGTNGSWVDLTSDLSSGLLRAGFDSANNIWARPQPSTFRARLFNDQGLYSASYSSGPFVEILDDDALVWRGRLERLQADENRQTAELLALGPWAEMRRLRSGVPIARNMRGGELIHGILNRANWPMAWRRLDMGDVAMPAYFTPEDTVEALLGGVRVWELGNILETRDYRIAFESRLHRAGLAHSLSAVTLGDESNEVPIRLVNKITREAQIINTAEISVQQLTTSSAQEIYSLEEPLRLGTDANDSQPLLAEGGYLLQADGVSQIVLSGMFTEIRIQANISFNQAVEWDDAVVAIIANTSADGSGQDVKIAPSRIALVALSANSAWLAIQLHTSVIFVTSVVITAPVTSRTVAQVVVREDTASIGAFGAQPSTRVTTWATSASLAHGYALELIDSFKNPGQALRLKFDLADGWEQEWRRWLGDRIGVNTIPRNGARIIGEYFIERLQLEFRSRGPASAMWDVSPVGRGPASTVDLSDTFLYGTGLWNVDRAAG